MSYLSDFDEYTKNEYDEQEKKDKRTNDETFGWDVFKYTPPKIKTGSKADTKFFDRTAQAIKILTYFVLFGFILSAGTIAKVTIIFAVSQLNDASDSSIDYCDFNEFEGRPSGRRVSASLPKNYQVGWYWCIIGIFAFPEFLSFVHALYNCFFKKRYVPGINDVVFLLIIETLHAIGLALLFLNVLPKFNSVQAAIVSSCTCLVPSILGAFSFGSDRGKSYFSLFGDVFALAAQIVGIILWIVPSDSLTIKDESRWILPVALVLSSSRWWGNYVPPSGNAGFLRVLSKFKERLDKSRALLEGFSSIWRILVFFTVSVLIAYNNGIDRSNFFNMDFLEGKYNVTLIEISHRRNFSTARSLSLDDAPLGEDFVGKIAIDAYYLPLITFLIHITCSLITYSSAKFSYRTMMQAYGFALPVNLVVPASVGALIVMCALRARETCALHKFLPDYVFFDAPANISHLDDFLNDLYPWIWLLTLPSQMWITRRIWLSHSERLAATENIFLVPSYDSLIIDQSIVLNRRDKVKIPEETPKIEKSQEKDDVTIETIYSEISGKSVLSETEHNDRVTKIIVCATMWHETEGEMEEFVGSILRLDEDQGCKRCSQEIYNIRLRDYYELETHVFFDDAFRCMHGCEGRCEHDENETQVNDYVMCLIDTVQRCIERQNYLAKPPRKYPSPYGGRLEWTLPGQTSMMIHLKDKNKIRHRKRWSQVMYMYYLLGYCLMDTPIDPERKKKIAENTYLLTLDGDIDFKPFAVKVLVDRMKRDKDLGAACGRIHPIGSGPIVWFQKFEYAIGHWLQKSTEHTIGSVLCSPGAFSLFRAKALMQHNVMKKYATESTDPMHYVQYDQGEDRWLCTLILQVGYRVEYAAASDSYTHAPETFNEFYNQRRRWIPSTIANMLDLLTTSEETRKANDDISLPYIGYQWILMGSTILGPGTIFLMLVGAFVSAFKIGNWISFGYNLIPITIFVVACFTCKPRIQLFVAGAITALYALVMIIVLVGIMLQIAEDGWVAPSTILFFVVSGQLVVAGLLHPQEWSCLPCGIIYYVTVPSAYMLLIIFAIFNVNNVTWGTRDSKANVGQQPEKTKDDDEQDKSKGRRSIGKNRGAIVFSFVDLFKCILCTHDAKSDEEEKLELISHSLDRIVERLDSIEKNISTSGNQETRRSEIFAARKNELKASRQMGSKFSTDDSEDYAGEYEEVDDENDDVTENDTEIYNNGSIRESSNFLVSPYWLQDERMRKGGVEFLSGEEETFWENLIDKYLHPIEEDKKKIEKTAAGLKNLRDECISIFFMVNALFVLIVFLMQLNKDVLFIKWPLGYSYNITFVTTLREVNVEKNYLQLEPIGCLFIVTFVAILGIQFIAMLFHRFDTFCHILASTTIEWPCCKKSEEIANLTDLEKYANDVADGWQRIVEKTRESKFVHVASNVPPRKRETIRELVESQSRVTPPATIDSLIRRHIDNARLNNSQFTSLPQNVLEAFEQRRATVIANQNQPSDHQNHNGNNTYCDPNDISRSSRLSNSTTPENSYGYDNRAFVSDDYGDDVFSDNDSHSRP